MDKFDTFSGSIDPHPEDFQARQQARPAKRERPAAPVQGNQSEPRDRSPQLPPEPRDELRPGAPVIPPEQTPQQEPPKERGRPYAVYEGIERTGTAARSILESVVVTYGSATAPAVRSYPPCIECHEVHDPLPLKCPTTRKDMPDTVSCPNCRQINWDRSSLCRTCSEPLWLGRKP